MRLVLALAVGLFPLFGQVCAPTPLLPVARVSGVLDDSNCRLPDGSRSAVYRVDLPVRGTLKLSVSESGSSTAILLRDTSGARIASGPSIERRVESGPYFVLVFGDTTPYTLRSDFAAEPGMWCTAFPSIGWNQTAAANLGSAGCKAPDGTPYDAFRLTTFGAGTLTLSLSDAEFSALLIIRDEDGHPLATDPAQITLDLDRDSQYTVVVATAGSTGAYKLTTSFQSLDGNACGPLRTFQDSDNDASTATPDACYHLNPATGAASPYTYYPVIVSSAGLASFTAQSDSFLPTLNLWDASGNLLASNTGAAGESQSEIHIPLSSGNYVIQVVSSLPAGGDYTLQYDFTPGPPVSCSASSAAIGDNISTTLVPSACPDQYRVTLAASGTLTATLTTTDFTGRVAIRSATGDLLVSGEDDQSLGTTTISADLPAGDYLVTVSSIFAAGTYSLTNTYDPHDLAPCLFLPQLDLNGGYIQRLAAGRSCRDAAGQPADYYQFSLPSDSIVAAFMTSGQVDSYLSLTTPNGAVLRSDDNSYGLQDAFFVQFLPAGDYRLLARAASSASGGIYEVDLRTIAGSRPPFCSPRGELDPGSATEGVINFAGCQFPDATFADLYQVPLDQDGTLDLQLASSDFAPALILLDSKGGVVDETGGDAHLSADLPAGTYYVVAKPVSNYTSGGRYRILRN